MQDNESENGNGDSDTASRQLRINIPTAAVVAGIDTEMTPLVPPQVSHPEQDHSVGGARRPDLSGAMRPRNESFTAQTPEAGDGEPVRRIVGRSLAERLADTTPTSSNTVESEEPKTGTFVLPDWSEPPTGLVPRVLLDDDVANGEEGELVSTGLRGPSWREAGSDWDNDADLAFLIDEEPDVNAPVIAGQSTPEHRPFDLGFDEIDIALSGEQRVLDSQWNDTIDDRVDVTIEAPEESGRSSSGDREGDGGGRHRRRTHRRAHESEADAKGERSGVIATIVGVGIGAIALLCFYLGPRTSLALIAFAVTLAAAELFSSLQRSGYRPATLIGLVTVPLMVIGTYLHGPIAVLFMVAVLMLGFGIWGVAGLTQKEPIINLGVTALVVMWTGVLGSFAGLLLNPNSFPHRHGLAYIIGAVALTVAHDVGSYAVGARLGRHPIAPAISPGKTREGLIGGSVLTIIVAVAIVAHIHPYTLMSAILLGIVVLVFAPLGDLFESVAKRDLGLKDMGKILPSHGGIFDRIDAMLFVLPATYILLRLLGKS